MLSVEQSCDIRPLKQGYPLFLTGYTSTRPVEHSRVSLCLKTEGESTSEWRPTQAKGAPRRPRAIYSPSLWRLIHIQILEARNSSRTNSRLHSKLLTMHLQNLTTILHFSVRQKSVRMEMIDRVMHLQILLLLLPARWVSPRSWPTCYCSSISPL